MIKKAKQLLLQLLSVPVILIAIPLIVIRNLIFGNKSKVSREEVLGYLERMNSGEVDDYWWDDFINVPIKDEKLDSIRERCEEIWHPDSGYLIKSAEKGEYQLNQSGFQEIQKLIHECKNMPYNNSLNQDAH